MVSAVAPAADTDLELQVTLADACDHFRGDESLGTIRRMLSKGVDVNLALSGGDTPLLLLCRALELDYRYRHEPAYRAALIEALELLLRNGADALHENEAGCNAIFFIEGQPELARQLRERKLLPRDLALRLPSGGAALSRYIQRRAAQAQHTTHAGSLDYLSRRYCAPIYDRVFARLQRYLRSESATGIPPHALRDCLAFLRVADRERISSWVNAHPYWEHSEHFLEEVPERFLAELCELNWEVDSDCLQRALHKLDTMLPRDANDMIECFAGIPMSRLLRMLDHVDEAAATPLIRKYADSRDSTLAAEALCLQLDRRRLPRPSTTQLLVQLRDPKAAAQTQLLDMARVDEFVEGTGSAEMDADTLRRVQTQLRELELLHHAELLELLFDGEEVTRDADALAEVRAAWSDPAYPSPQMAMARFIMEHPELFTSRSAHGDEAAAEILHETELTHPTPAPTTRVQP